MNLQSEVSQDMWSAISGTYEAGNYSHAVLDAIQHISSILRERTGLDGDGHSLVGQALGGDAPRLRINSLQTDSERNVQKGIEHVLRGVYLGIRNPRSHETLTDTKRTADAIIVFLDYIAGLLNSSQQSFTPAGFVSRARDSEFVDTERYAELLLAEVPPLRRGDALIALFHERRLVDPRKLRHIIRLLLSQLSDAQLVHYLAVASEELRSVSDDASIRSCLQMLAPEHWPRLSEVSRLRVEYKLIAGIKLGETNAAGYTTEALATWARQFLRYFTLTRDAALTLIRKLEDADADDRHYVAKFFMGTLPNIVTSDQLRARCVRAMAAAVRMGDENVRSALISNILTYPAEWQSQLASTLADQTDPSNPAAILNDGSPFLSSPSPDDFFGDDTPF